MIKVGEQISEVIRPHLAMDRRERKSRVEDLLREVGFDEPQSIYAAYPHQLSGGQRQRIVIAQAMACRPALVIADEPTSKLDSALQAEVLTLMSEIRRRHGTALLMISHDPTIFAGFADRIAACTLAELSRRGTQKIFSGSRCIRTRKRWYVYPRDVPRMQERVARPFRPLRASLRI